MNDDGENLRAGLTNALIVILAAVIVGLIFSGCVSVLGGLGAIDSDLVSRAQKDNPNHDIYSVVCTSGPPPSGRIWLVMTPKNKPLPPDFKFPGCPW